MRVCVIVYRSMVMGSTAIGLAQTRVCAHVCVCGVHYRVSRHAHSRESASVRGEQIGVQYSNLYLLSCEQGGFVCVCVCKRMSGSRSGTGPVGTTIDKRSGVVTFLTLVLGPRSRDTARNAKRRS